MSWEINYTVELRCDKCGRTGKEINRSDDWNNHQTIFENFDTAYRGRPRAGEPNLGAVACPVCPTCGEDAHVTYGERR